MAIACPLWNFLGANGRRRNSGGLLGLFCFEIAGLMTAIVILGASNMRTVLTSMIAIAVAAGGLTAASVAIPGWDSPALAAKAKAKSSGKRTERTPARQRTGFEHQQCTVQDPCSTRNTW